MKKRFVLWLLLLQQCLAQSIPIEFNDLSPNTEYSQQSSVDLISWETDATITTDSNGSYSLFHTWNDPEIQESIYYRLQSNATPSTETVHLSWNSDKPTPVTFGYHFSEGIISSDQEIVATLEINNVQETIAVQIDRKASHQDGSLRHAIISTLLPAGEETNIPLNLTASDTELQQEADTALSTLSESGLKVNVILDIEGQTYRVKLEDLWDNNQLQWLSGPIAGEWHFVSDLISDENDEHHPHLQARFHVRKYSGSNNVRVDVIIENNWTFDEQLQGYTYDVQLLVNDSVQYAFDDLQHFPRTRWKKTLWTEGEPQVFVAHDPMQLINSRAVPSYDTSLIGLVDSSQYSSVNYDEIITTDQGKTANFSPMGIGDALAYMPTTGGRTDIGPLPKWSAIYLLSQDPISKTHMLQMADTSGSWGIHYRHRSTGLPVTITDFPQLSIHFNANESPPDCIDNCDSPYTPDSAHQPEFSYLPYLVTGDYFYLEELAFWNTYNLLALPAGDKDHPSWGKYRREELGSFDAGQIRSRAWNIRTLARMAYISPDDYSMKEYFETILSNNITIFDEEYATGPANSYGALDPGNQAASRPWMDDFLTWSFSQVVDFGYEEALNIAQWKAQFPVQRMGYGFEGNRYCWIMAASYNDPIVDAEGDYFTDINALWDNNHADLEGQDCGSEGYNGLLEGEMSGRSDSYQGYVAILQAALAGAVNINAEQALEAWMQYEERSIVQDYTENPNWALAPRDLDLKLEQNSD